MEEKQLQIIIDELLMNVNQFSRSVGVSSDTIYNILRNKTKMTAGVKKKIFDAYPNINRIWFETGQGEMYTWKNKPESLQLIKEESVNYESVCKLCQEKERYIKSLEDRVAAQKSVIESQEKCIDALRALGGGNIKSGLG